jgi:hypothetical protein
MAGTGGDQPAEVAREGVRQDVLAGAVQPQVLGQGGGGLEQLPGEAADGFGLRTVGVAEDQGQVVAAGGPCPSRTSSQRTA